MNCSRHDWLFSLYYCPIFCVKLDYLRIDLACILSIIGPSNRIDTFKLFVFRRFIARKNTIIGWFVKMMTRSGSNSRRRRNAAIGPIKGGWHEKIINIFALKSLFQMTRLLKKYLRFFEKFEHLRIHSHFQGVFEYSKIFQKLFLLGRGIDVTSRGERLLARSIAAMLKD